MKIKMRHIHMYVCLSVCVYEFQIFRIRILCFLRLKRQDRLKILRQIVLFFSLEGSGWNG